MIFFVVYSVATRLYPDSSNYCTLLLVTIFLITIGSHFNWNIKERKGKERKGKERKGKERKGRDVWPSMVSKCTHTAVRSEQTHTHTVNTHLGSSWEFGALLKVSMWRECWLFTPPPPPPPQCNAIVTSEIRNVGYTFILRCPCCSVVIHLSTE